MSIGELLAALKNARISVVLDGDSLVVKGNKGLITDEIKSSLVKNKQRLIEILKSDRLIALNGRGEVPIPGNAIEEASTVITPEMLPLIDLTQEDIDRIVEGVPGGVANIQDIYGLSPLQEGILFHHVLASEGDPYILSDQMAFPEKAQLERFLSAVQQVIDRHDILRTSFMWEGLSKAAQVVWRRVRLSVEEVELDRQEGPIAEQLGHRLDTRLRRMDLTQAPLLRFVVAYDREHDRWVLVQRRHHLIGDHSTLDVLRAEVYALLNGQGDRLGAPPAFRNFVAQARMGMTQEEHERFFRQMLGEVTEATLPFGLGDVHQEGGEITETHRMLAEGLNDRLRAQARRVGVSLASLCHLAWGQVLGRSSGNERVVFGTVLYGRMQGVEGADQAVGMFINTLPLRLDLDVTGSERAVGQVHARLAELLTHEHASLVLAQRCSGVAAPRPLFNALLNYRHNLMPAALKDDGERNDPLAGVEVFRSRERSNYPLIMSVEDFGQALGLTAQVVQPLSSERVCGYMQQALESLVLALETAPDTPVRQLEILPPEERKLLPNETKLGGALRRRPPVSVNTLIKPETLLPDNPLPLLIQPRTRGVDLISWARSNREQIEAYLLQHGGILFRNFNVSRVEDFERFIVTVAGESLEYRERSSPRRLINGRIYTSTDYPMEYGIFPHNENSYQRTWPLKIFFFCIAPAESGGETPITNCRRVYERIDPEIRNRFISKKWKYVRNLGGGFGLDWQRVFGTTDRAAVESHCRDSGIEVEWKQGNRLKISATRPAVARHPRTNELLWFNHAAFFHVSTLEPAVRDQVLANFAEADLPATSYYGDGSTIDGATVDHLRRAYMEATVSFPWQAGDLLMLDNMLTAHGRAAYSGPRNIAVGMAERITATEN
jgi:alpha-ketoglutarate-dependent taurine dioxygenase